jgi:hypothetical protein
MENKKKILLGLLTNRGFKPRTVMSLLHMINNDRSFEWIPVLSPTCYTISEHRNWLAARSVKEEADFLMMVDDDMTFPPETAKVLAARDVDIISVPFHTKKFPRNVTVKAVAGSIASEIAYGEVSAVGTGIILIKTDVFKKVPQPWFDTDKTKEGFTTMGEDYWFSKKAREYGIRIWSEPLEISHIGDFAY